MGLRSKKPTITTEYPITCALDDNRRELMVTLKFNEEQWPNIRAVADGTNVRLKCLSFDWEKVNP